VQYNAKQLQLKSQLQNQYSAYEISFTNISNDPIKADAIQCLNKINVPDISQSMKLKKGTKWAMALCPFTLGISCIGAMPEISERNKQTSYLLDEQKRYTSYYGESLPVSKAEIQPGETIRYNLLVPLNEQPEITATFQNIKTNKYFNVSEK
jgi:hypothetical protein